MPGARSAFASAPGGHVRIARLPARVRFYQLPEHFLVRTWSACATGGQIVVTGSVRIHHVGQFCRDKTTRLKWVSPDLPLQRVLLPPAASIATTADYLRNGEAVDVGCGGHAAACCRGVCRACFCSGMTLLRLCFERRKLPIKQTPHHITEPLISHSDQVP